ncbi:hypothetical protein JRQ81_013485, partial [Phrynocephalus forsythii]
RGNKLRAHFSARQTHSSRAQKHAHLPVPSKGRSQAPVPPASRPLLRAEEASPSALSRELPRATETAGEEKSSAKAAPRPRWRAGGAERRREAGRPGVAGCGVRGAGREEAWDSRWRDPSLGKGAGAGAGRACLWRCFVSADAQLRARQIAEPPAQEGGNCFNLHSPMLKGYLMQKGAILCRNFKNSVLISISSQKKNRTASKKPCEIHQIHMHTDLLHRSLPVRRK